jgi:membrane protein YdbS with pleckstrin-like domain
MLSKFRTAAVVIALAVMAFATCFALSVYLAGTAVELAELWQKNSVIALYAIFILMMFVLGVPLDKKFRRWLKKLEEDEW